MNGRNLFESRWISFGRKTASAGPQPGVFISYSRKDKEKARDIVRALEVSNVDYYFDEKDEELQLADEEGDHLKVVQCIKDGLEVCTHLLGIITENTKDSWWVPYEIGRGTGRDRACAHLIDKEVSELPSYIKAAKILVNRAALREWLPVNHEKKAIASRMIVELSKTIAMTEYPSFIPNSRTVDDLTFY